MHVCKLLLTYIKIEKQTKLTKIEKLNLSLTEISTGHSSSPSKLRYL